MEKIYGKLKACDEPNAIDLADAASNTYTAGLQVLEISLWIRKSRLIF